MKFKIYQPYFNNDDRLLVDPGFEPFDNTANPAPHLREYYINLIVKDLANKEGLDYWGSFSLRWKEKLPGCDSNFVIDRINGNPGYDVYFFNGFIDQVLQSYNVWEQGLWHHRHLVTIMESALSLMGLDPNLVYQPMGRKTAFFACYCVANAEFWNGYLAMVDKFVSVMPLLPQEVQDLLCGPSHYSRDPNLWNFPFIQERLFSTYLVLNQKNLRILPYHHNEQMYLPQYGHVLDLKDRAIEEKDKNLLNQWRLTRNSICGWPDYCEPWIQHFNGNL